MNSGSDIKLSLDDITRVKYDVQLVTAFSIIILSYNVQFLVFPAYVELKNRNSARFAKSSLWSIIFETMTYLITGFTAILMFGPNDIKPDMLENMAQRDGMLSVVIRLVFCLLLIFDVPFLFFATKEQSLVLHDEIVNNSLSEYT